MDRSHLPALLVKNLELLNQHQPLLTSRLYLHLEEHGLPELIQTETAQGVWVSGSMPRPFFQKKDIKIAVKREDHDNPLFGIFGAGIPPSLFSHLRKLPPQALGIVAFEPNPELLLHTLSLTSVFMALPRNCRIAFVVYPDDQLIDEALGVSIRPMGLFVTGDMALLHHPGEAEAYEEEFEALLKIFRERMRLSLQFLGNTAEDTLLGVRNMFLNAPWIWKTPPMSSLIEEYKGRPFIWVGSGPSLEKNIHLLKGAREKAIVIAAESATKKLLKQGIAPHFMVALERPWTTYSNLIRPLIDEFPEECGRIVLMGQSVLTSQAFGCWPGPVMVFGKAELPLDQWLVAGALGGALAFSGASVAHMGTVLAGFFKPSAMALVGQDLAFAEGFVSHASDTASTQTMALEADRGKNDHFRVPAAAGGEIDTHFIWFAFLKIFEGMIPSLPFPLFDCTEGGALIKGTEFIPLSEFIEDKVDPLQSIEKTPDIMVKEKAPHFESSFLDERIQRAESILSHLDSFLQLLDDLREAIDRVGAPAVTPAKRREMAYAASSLMDDYHARNSALAFIGQSYTSLAGVEVAKSRSLETVEEVERWQKAFGEIHDAHRAVVLFVKGYLKNAIAAARFYALGDDHTLPEICTGLAPLSREEGMKAIDALLAALRSDGPGHPYTDELFDVCMQNIIARSDPPHHEWDPEYQWQCARFLEQQERIHLATMLMHSAANLFVGRTMPVDLIVAFFKDGARIFLQNDFTHIPNTAGALHALTSAEEYAPDDDEITQLREQALESKRALFNNLLSSGMYDADEPEVRRSKREIQAHLMLAEGRLAETMLFVWEMIETASTEDRQSLTHYIHWLLQTMAKCRQAADPGIRDAIGKIIDRLAKDYAEYSAVRVLWPAEILQELEKRGVKISVLAADTN